MVEKITLKSLFYSCVNCVQAVNGKQKNVAKENLKRSAVKN